MYFNLILINGEKGKWTTNKILNLRKKNTTRNQQTKPNTKMLYTLISIQTSCVPGRLVLKPNRFENSQSYTLWSPPNCEGEDDGQTDRQCAENASFVRLVLFLSIL